MSSNKQRKRVRSLWLLVRMLMSYMHEPQQAAVHNVLPAQNATAGDCEHLRQKRATAYALSHKAPRRLRLTDSYV